MRVAIETTVMRGPLTGIGQYVSGLVRALIEIASHDLELLEFDGIALRPIGREFADVAKTRNDGMVERGIDRQARHRRFYDTYLNLREWPLARALARYTKEKRFQSIARQFDVFHAIQTVPPGPCNKPVLPVIHDLSHLRFPQFHPSERVRWLEKRLPLDAMAIQTVSNFSKRELVELCGVPPERIHVSYPGVAEHFTGLPSTDDEAALNRHRLSGKSYFLIVSTREPRKNVATVADAYLALPAAIQARFPLVWIGHRGWGNIALSAQAEAACRDGRIRLMGYVADADLASLFRHSKAFIMPSLYEGFGMPVVEAMACGANLLISDIPVFREVAGCHASYIDPLDVNGWRNALNQAIDDPQSDPDDDGRKAWLARYRWEHNARASVALYRQLAFEFD